MKKFFLYLLFLGLGACGFSPLYSSNTDTLLTEQTSSVDIQPIEGILGFQLKSFLKDKLNPTDLNTEKKYRLTVRTEVRKTGDQVIARDKFSTLGKIVLKGRYKMTEIKTGAVVLESTADASGTYNILKQPYATVSMEDKLLENLTKVVADKIALHTVAYFKHVEMNRASQTVSD